MIKYIYLLFISIALVGCGENENENISPEEIAKAKKIGSYSPIILERKGIKLTELYNIPQFSDVSVSLQSNNQNLKLGENKLEFKTELFNMGESTAAENDHGVKLNEQGQFLGVIRNNKAFSKNYGKDFTAEVENGENYFLCFLSRSYNASLKHDAASFLFKVTADTNGCYSETGLSDTAYGMIEPRGSYVGVETERLILDFYLKNIELSNNGNYAVITIDQLDFKINKWATYIVRGLKLGDHKISIQVYNKKGEKINSILENQCSTEFTLKTLSVIEE